VAPGETISIATTWDVKLPSVVERTGYAGSFHMIAQWFPKIARLEPDGTFAHFPFHRLSEFYADFGTYDVTMDVPDNFVIGATGPVASSRVENGRRIERHVQADVHDFAWTAWDKFKAKSEDIDGVHVSALFPPDYDAVADREMATIRFSLPYYQRRYGPYPYSVLTLVHPPDEAGEAGGMEYPTLITTGGSWFEPRIVLEPELLTAHEFGHQYFYGLMASNEMLYPFLDEGVNSFAEEDALGNMFGDASGGGLWGISVSDIAAHVVNARNKDAFVAEPAYAFPTGASYGSLAYSRTAVILETFKRVYGEEKFWAAMTDYTKKWRFSHPTPDDFVACFYDEVSPDAARELHAALFERGAVDYVVSDMSSREITSAAGIFDADGKRETVKGASRNEYEGWVLVSRRGPLRLPVDID
ncbi:MAG: M1 family metallopeptidase, partial [Polyangiaceae bacterium]